MMSIEVGQCGCDLDLINRLPVVEWVAAGTVQALKTSRGHVVRVTHDS